MTDPKNATDPQAKDATRPATTDAAEDLPKRDVGDKDAAAVKGGMTSKLAEKF